MKAFHLKTVLAMTMAVFTLSCAGGLKGSKEEKVAYFDRLEKDTLALLIKEHSESEQELAEAVGYTIAEKRRSRCLLWGWGRHGVASRTLNRKHCRFPLGESPSLRRRQQ